MRNEIPEKWIIRGEPRSICELEQKLKKKNNKYKYIPQIKFNGMYECYLKINNDENISA